MTRSLTCSGGRGHQHIRIRHELSGAVTTRLAEPSDHPQARRASGTQAEPYSAHPYRRVVRFTSSQGQNELTTAAACLQVLSLRPPHSPSIVAHDGLNTEQQRGAG
jgi:hypothetical protein